MVVSFNNQSEKEDTYNTTNIKMAEVHRVMFTQNKSEVTKFLRLLGNITADILKSYTFTSITSTTILAKGWFVSLTETHRF